MSAENDNRTIQPYLFFEGRCDEAIQFYRRAIGAEVLTLTRYKESPEPPPPGMLPPNRYLIGALAASYGAQSLVQLVPGLRNLLGLTKIDMSDLMVVAAGAVVPFFANEATKLLPLKEPSISGASARTEPRQIEQQHSRIEPLPYLGKA